MPSKNEVTFLRVSVANRMLFLFSVVAALLLVVSSVGATGWVLTHQPPKSPVTSFVTNLQDDGVGSFRWAIENTRSESTITFDKSLWGGTITLASDLVIINKSLRIQGPPVGTLTISNSTHQIDVHSDASISIYNLTFEGTESYSTSLLSNEGQLFLTNTTVSDNTSGGISNSGTLTLTNSIVSHNNTGISNSGTLTLINSTVSHNYGGGISNSGTLTLIKSIVSDNSVLTQYGDGPINVGEGGGIFSDSYSTLTLINSIVSHNSASGQSSVGGGIYNVHSTLTLTNSIVSDNSASGQSSDGGGILNSDGKLFLTNSIVSHNSASGQSSDGGGIFDSDSGTLTLTNSTISDNSAQGSGGGIFNIGSNASINFCTIYGNTATRDGGGVSIQDNLVNSPPTPSYVVMRNNLVAGNHARTGPDIAGMLTSDGYNLIRDISSTIFTQNKQHYTDMSVDTRTDLKIDPMLRDNGGPTKTHALLPGSPAIDAIPLQSCQVKGIGMYTDQRSVKRPDDKERFCDIGAYESVDSG